MPRFEPRQFAQPGVEPPPLDAKTKSIVDGFSVVSQQIEWLAEKFYEMQTAYLAAQNLQSEIEALRTELASLRMTPYKMLWEGFKTVLLCGTCSFMTWLFTKGSP